MINTNQTQSFKIFLVRFVQLWQAIKIAIKHSQYEVHQVNYTHLEYKRKEPAHFKYYVKNLEIYIIL